MIGTYKPVVDAVDTQTGRMFSLGVGAFRSTIHSGGEPRAAVVVHSETGEYLGSFELRALEAHELSEEVRKAAEAASRYEEEY